MAEIFPDEGLDYLLGLLKGGTAPANLYLFGFTSQSPSTVPGRTAVLATNTGVTEAAGTSYARLAVAAADWGAAATNGSGRRITAAQKTLATVGAGGWGTWNGFGLASALTGGVAVYYANFDDGLTIPTAVNDIIKITPFFQLDG